MIAIGKLQLRNSQEEIRKCVIAGIKGYFYRQKMSGNLNKTLKSNDYTKNKSFLGEKLAFVFQVNLLSIQIVQPNN